MAIFVGKKRRSIPVNEIVKLFGRDPLFGHNSGSIKHSLAVLYENPRNTPNEEMKVVFIFWGAFNPNTRERNISFADMRNIVCLCQRHHGYFKQQNGALYWDLIRKHIGPERWTWLQRVIADRKTYLMGIYEWGKLELALKQELKAASETL